MSEDKTESSVLPEAPSTDLAIRLLEQALLELRGHRHEFKGLVNNFTLLSAGAILSHKQIEDMHTTMKIAQGYLHNFSSVPTDLTEIKNGLLNKATENRSGIPLFAVVLLFTLFAILVAVPNWLPVIKGSNLDLNVTRDGVGIKSQENKNGVP